MSIFSSKIDGELLTLFADGRIDSTNSPVAEQEIEEIRKGAKYSKIVFDAEKLEYISSAGLRIILRLRKNEPTLEVINVSSDVYEIFEMTGFTEMIPVAKAYRNLSVDGCEVIGRGANGIVYRYDPEIIVKVYFNSDALPDIKRERELARRAFVLGIPTAIPYDIVKVGTSFGSVFELLNAKSFTQLILESPEKTDEYIKLFVDLAKKIHSTEVLPEDMPDMKEVALNWAKFVKEYIPEEKGRKLVDLVEKVPVRHTMLHGDYHLNNVMMQNGEVLLIDMDTLCQGDPVFELASVFNAFCGFSEVDHTVIEKFFGLSYDQGIELWQKFIQLYFETDDKEKLEEYSNKAKLIGYVRLYRRLIRRDGMNTELGRKELEVYKTNILNLLDSVDSLSF